MAYISSSEISELSSGVRVWFEIFIQCKIIQLRGIARLIVTVTDVRILIAYGVLRSRIVFLSYDVLGEGSEKLSEFCAWDLSRIFVDWVNS